MQGSATITYRTRDEKGNDFVKEVELKSFPAYDINGSTECAVCGKEINAGCRVKDCVSGNFTDWAYIHGDYICPECARLLNLYFYSYIVENGEIQLFNVREIKENLLRAHVTPFKFIITVNRKKHLFYRTPENLSDGIFAVQLETETICTSRERQEMLFSFVENMMALGQGKEQMGRGEISFEVYRKVGERALNFLDSELRLSREIQIPLYCGQKLNITEEEAKCNLDLILKA